MDIGAPPPVPVKAEPASSAELQPTVHAGSGTAAAPQQDTAASGPPQQQEQPAPPPQHEQPPQPAQPPPPRPTWEDYPSLAWSRGRDPDVKTGLQRQGSGHDGVVVVQARGVRAVPCAVAQGLPGGNEMT